MSMNWSYVEECNFCGGREFSTFMISELPDWYEDRPLQLIECDTCRLVTASPRPDRYEIYKSYLTGDDFARKMTERKLARPNVLAIHRKAVEHSLGFLEHEPKRLYDMGCGAGSLMREAHSLGIEAWGNDINLHSIDALREDGFNALHGFTVDIEIPENYFDIVINFDYVEHTYEPFHDLKKCYRALIPGGVMSLKTLYLDCPDHIMKNEEWQLFHREHFHFFWPRTLKAMVESVGFEIVDLRLGPLVRIMARKPAG